MGLCCICHVHAGRRGAFTSSGAFTLGGGSSTGNTAGRGNRAGNDEYESETELGESGHESRELQGKVHAALTKVAELERRLEIARGEGEGQSSAGYATKQPEPLELGEADGADALDAARAVSAVDTAQRATCDFLSSQFPSCHITTKEPEESDNDDTGAMAR